MRYLIDSVRINDINKFKNIVCGFTINPVMLEELCIPFDTFIQESNKIVPYDFLKFIQINNIEEADFALDIFKNKNFLIFKVIMHPKNFDLIKKLKERDLLVATTSMYDLTQLNQAIEMDVDYTMIYYYKNKDKDFIYHAYELKNKFKSKIQLIGASFREREDVEQAIKAGMDYATVKPNTLKKLFENEQLLSDLER